jgi:carbon-monoxide dehydrogenase medium subunit
MDSGPTLVALEAIAVVAGPAGRREVPLSEFWIGPRKTVLKPDELLAEILIPKQNLNKPTHFLKFGLRKGQALALVNVASSFNVDWNKNTFVAPRIALGAVAPKVVRASQAEAYLEADDFPETMFEAGQLQSPTAADQRLPCISRVPRLAPYQRRTLRRRLQLAGQAVIGRRRWSL